MNKKAILQTALLKHDSKRGDYIIKSPLCDRVIGVGKTRKEAMKIFNELLNETYIAYLEGKLVGYEKRGRPARGNVEFHTQVKPEIKKHISKRAQELGVSQGDVIAYLVAAEQAAAQHDRYHPVLNDKQWGAFCTALDAPPKANQKLHALMSSRAPWQS